MNNHFYEFCLFYGNGNYKKGIVIAENNDEAILKIKNKYSDYKGIRYIKETDIFEIGD